MGNVHVANGSSAPIRVRVSQMKLDIKDIEMSAKVSALEGSFKANMVWDPDQSGFVLVGQGECLEFDVDDLSWSEGYVTIITDDTPPKIICDNYNPPCGRSVIVTDHHTIQLSTLFGDRWKTESGICYGPNCRCNIKSVQAKIAMKENTDKEIRRNDLALMEQSHL